MMPRQKKSALPAATVQSTQGNIIHVQFKARKCKSQEGKIIQLEEGRKRLRKCPPNLKRAVQEIAKARRNQPISVEAARRLLDEILTESRCPAQCPNSSIKTMQRSIARARGGSLL